MLNESTERLFGGINKAIAEKYAQMHIAESKCVDKKVEESSVSDTSVVPVDGKVTLNEKPCKDKIEESQDYHTFMKREDFDKKINSLGLKSEHSGKDHEEVKDASGDLKGWWNGHTGVGYLRKDCCGAAIHEDTVSTSFVPNQRQEDQTQTETGDFTPHESLKLAIQTAANRAKESGTHYHDEIVKDLGTLGLDLSQQATQDHLNQATSEMTDGKYHDHMEYGNDHVAGRLREEKLDESPIISRGGNEPGVDGVNIKEETLEEAHLTPELSSKIEDYVHKLKPKMSDFKDKYGEDAESVMYGTATKLAKHDLGIKD